MGIFSINHEQDDRLDAIERQMRRMTEQIGQLSVDLGATRMELLKMRAAVGDAVKAGEVDPMFGGMNESLVKARAQLKASKQAADEAWVTLQSSSDDALETMRTGIDSAWSTLDEADS